MAPLFHVSSPSRNAGFQAEMREKQMAYGILLGSCGLLEMTEDAIARTVEAMKCSLHKSLKVRKFHCWISWKSCNQMQYTFPLVLCSRRLWPCQVTGWGTSWYIHHWWNTASVDDGHPNTSHDCCWTYSIWWTHYRTGGFKRQWCYTETNHFYATNTLLQLWRSGSCSGHYNYPPYKGTSSGFKV